MTEDKPITLIVHPDAGVLASLFRLLDDEDCPAATSPSGMDAFRSACRRKPAILLTAPHLPDMEGLELVRRVKEVSPGTRALVLAASPDWVLIPDALAAGVDDFIAASASPEELLWSVRRVPKEERHAPTAK